ncbi:hypothetical protein C8R43DRAFT_860971, partial [Mycena crocata]
RGLMRQMINSMSTKMEIGSPMASMYILGNPDHYKSHVYVNFAWRSSVVDDYRFRPVVYEKLNLYEWVQTSDKKVRTRKEQAHDWDSDDDDDTVVKKEAEKLKSYRVVRHAFIVGHDLRSTHSVHCDMRKLTSVIPNFLGGAIPRADKGDREYYCMSMMTLFKPWRSPVDLKDAASNWDQIFVEHEFTPRQEELIANFNLRYECNDARDD